MIIAHNLAAMNAQRQFNIVGTEKKKSTEKLASGYRINRAADDAAGLSISEKMRSQIRGLMRGSENTQDGVSFVQIADGALNEATEMMQRMNELCVKAANGTNSESDRKAINEEIQQLKAEIKRVGITTKFNETPVFEDCDFATMNVSGKVKSIGVYNATYDDATGDVTYGGFLFDGERVSWDKVKPGMVYTGADGKQHFKDGEYAWQSSNGAKFSIRCVDDCEVPQFVRTMDIDAVDAGLSFDGTVYPWSELKDEYGVPIGSGNFHSGDWHLNCDGLLFNITLGMEVNSYSDVQKAIDKCIGKGFSYETGAYIDSVNEKAVDANMPSGGVVITNASAAAQTLGNDIKYYVHADKDGVWLAGDNDVAIADSKKSWSELVGDFSNGTDIQKNIKYTYIDNDGNNDTRITFNFTLSDITSIDSIVDGLDGMQLTGSYFSTYGGNSTYKGISDSIIGTSISTNYSMSFEQEKNMSRDFDQKEPIVGTSNVVYDEAANTAKIAFVDNNTNNVMEMEGKSDAAISAMKYDTGRYLDVVEATIKTHILNGDTGYVYPVRKGSLANVVGTGNITSSGYMSETVEITSGMKITDGSYGYELTGNHIAAIIDFKDLGTGGKTVSDLEGYGFDSTCLTCSEHYSIQFSRGCSENTVTDGGHTYGYTYNQSGHNDFIVKIDLDTFDKAASGKDITEGIVAILKESRDGHYTQYAADGSKLYVFDERPVDTYDPTKATFYPVTYNKETLKEYNISFNSTSASDNDTAKITYTVNIGDAASDVKVEMKENPAGGKYIADYSDSGNITGYHVFNAATDLPKRYTYDSVNGTYVEDINGDYIKKQDGTYETYDADRYKTYDISVSYKKLDGSFTSNREEYLDEKAKTILKDAISNTEVTLEATNYSQMKLYGNENPNVAVRANYDNEVNISRSYYDERNWVKIQHSSNVSDNTMIPRLTLNGYVLHMENADVTTEERALITLENVGKGLAYLTEIRSLYGAYQNRLEHTIRNLDNTAENTQAAESRIRDTDMAKEVMNNTKLNILEQAVQSMLAQANQSTQGALSLLQ